MGLYRIMSASSGSFRIRELVTGWELDAMIPTGFRAEAGCMAFLRVLPPLAGARSAHIAITTPYVTVGTSERDWLQYFERQQILTNCRAAMWSAGLCTALDRVTRR